MLRVSPDLPFPHKNRASSTRGPSEDAPRMRLQLYVNYSDKALQAYQQDVKGNTENANHYWPEVAKLLKIIR
jgi:hypothetical protein